MMNFLRWLGIAVCAVLMLGFGICGAFGVVSGASTMNVGAMLITGVPGAIGLGLAYGCFRLVRALVRRNKPGQQEPGD